MFGTKAMVGGGGVGVGVDKQTYITRNCVTHLPRGVIRILKL